MAEEPEKTEEKPKGNMKKTIGMIVIGVGVGLLVGKMFLFKSSPASTTVVVEATETTVFSRLHAVSVTLDNVIVNLAGGHYASIKTTVFFSAEGGAELGAHAKPEELKPKLAKISADIDTYVAGKTVEEVTTEDFKRELRLFLMEEAEVDYEGAIADIRPLVSAQ